MDIHQEDVAAFVDNLAVVTQLIDSSLLHQSEFKDIVAKQKDFVYQTVDSFIGLGALRYHQPLFSDELIIYATSSRYFPSFLQGSDISIELSSEIDRLNSKLALKLSEIDNIFSGTLDEKKITTV